MRYIKNGKAYKIDGNFTDIFNFLKIGSVPMLSKCRICSKSEKLENAMKANIFKKRDISYHNKAVDTVLFVPVNLGSI